MFKKTNIYFSQSRDPYKNLAIENYLLNKVSAKEEQLYILIWVNDPCIVMGRFQNPIIECDPKLMLQNKTKLVRRQSGGGCVYHDHNNLNFSFIIGSKNHPGKIGQRMIIDSLENLGLSPITNKRGDILLKDIDDIIKKFSGSAYKQKKDSSFYHGTILVDTDLIALNKYLIPKNLDIKSKSIDSVRSKVINLKKLQKDISIDKIVSSLTKVAENYSDSVYVMSDCIHDQEYYEWLKNIEWIYFETPKFIFPIESTSGIINFTINKMKIVDVEGAIENLDQKDFLDQRVDTNFVQKIYEKYPNIAKVFSDKFVAFEKLVGHAATTS
ncbi:MAG: lipoate--protein ligase [Bacteriovoracaceae bacterium]|jgi:lipoate-protein ligase A|nr:lipoate--protein ligase [Bacteriovoracaceae bacterium]